MTAPVRRIDDARRGRARAAIAAAAADAMEAAREARAVVTSRMRTTSPGRRRIVAAVDALERALARGGVGDDRPTAADRAAAAEALRAASRVRDELRRTSEQLERAARRRDRTVLERAVDAPADAAAAVAAEVSRTLGGLADRVERAVTTVASSAVDAWGDVVPTIGLGGALILAVLVYALVKK